MTAEEGIDLVEVRSLAARLAAVPKEFRREIRKPLREAGQGLLKDGSRGSSWSSRIPSALSLRVTLSGRRPGVALRASLAAAPHARVYEGLLGSTFRHPLFGDFDFWYSQRARPYMVPAAEKNAERLVREITPVVDAVHKRAGLI